MKGVTEQAQDAFKDMSKEARAKLYADAHGLFGTDLSAMVNMSLTQLNENRHTSDFSMKGNYLDKEDLEGKYKNKPTQLKSIMVDTQRYECSVRGCTVYPDPEVESSDVATNIISETLNVRLKQTSKSRKKSKPRRRKTRETHQKKRRSLLRL